MMCHHRNAVHYTHELQSSVLCFLNINHRTARHSLTTATNSQHICMYVKLKFLAWNTRPVAPLIVSPPTGHTAPCAAPTRRHRLISHESLALQMLLFWIFFGYLLSLYTVIVRISVVIHTHRVQ